MTNRIIIGVILAGLAIGGLETFREPIYTISFQTTMQFDIVSVVTAYIVGFVSAVFGFRGNDDSKDDTNAQ